MPRFVVLRHELPDGHPRESHWDLMLECAGALRTWACPHAPESQTTMFVQSLGDHRLAYLEYEGAVSGDRGNVSRWDEGTYQFVQQSEQKLVARFEGRKLRGRVALERWSGEPHRWRFSFAES